MKNSYRIVAFIFTLVFLAAVASYAANPPMCPHILGWNGEINEWAKGAPWIKVINRDDIPRAQAVGAKVFYRPYDADSQYNDDGDLPSSRTGTQFAEMVWNRVKDLAKKPDVIAYRNEFNWGDPTTSKRTCREFLNYYDRLRTLGYTGKIVFGSFGVGWVESAVWEDTDCKNAVIKSDGVETHEYFDLQVNCCAPWLAFRHRDLAIAQHSYLQSKEWYIGEFGSDQVCGHCPTCDDSANCRQGWRDRGKLTEQQYIDQMKIYRQGCAAQVVAVFVFQQGSSGWANFETMGTTVADYMKTTWIPDTGALDGAARNTSGAALSGVTITLAPGNYSAATDVTGYYTLDSVPVGTYTATASKTGYYNNSASVTINANQSTTKDFTMIAIPPAKITGYVRDTSGNVIPGATVSTNIGGYSAQSGTNGIYALTNVLPGTYDITASKSGYGQQTQAGKIVTVAQTLTLHFSLTPTTPISTAKGLADGASVLVDGIVTAKFPVDGSQTSIYLQDPNSNAGIAVSTTTPVSLADEVQVSGTMSTSDGERILNATKVTIVRAMGSVVKRLGMNNRALGGGQFGLQSAVLNKLSTTEYAKGLNNVGTLVRAWGRVSYVDPASAYFYIDDGSGIADSPGRSGIRVACSGLPTPTIDSYVYITGISGVTLEDGKPIRYLRPRSALDLSYAPPPNMLNNPGFETGTLPNWSYYGSTDGLHSGSWYAGITAHSGSWFFGNAANWGTKSGGLFQRIAVPAGYQYQAKAWSAVFRVDNNADSVQNRVGIDPTGGTSATSGSIVWSEVDMQPVDNYSKWRELTTPTVTCTGGYVTIFLDAKQLDGRGWNVNCFDDAGVYSVMQ